MRTNGYFALKETFRSGPITYDEVYKGSVSDIIESQLVMCNSGNLILKGYNGKTEKWSVLWRINERPLGTDCL